MSNPPLHTGSHLPRSSKVLTPSPESIRRLPLLADISDQELSLVLQHIRIEQFPKHEHIIQKGSQPDSLVFLLAGQMQVIDVTEDGREIGLRMLVPGDFFGELSIISGKPRTASVISLTSVVAAFLPRSTALHLFSHSPSIANKMMKILAEKITKDSELRSMLSIQNSSKRVYALLESLITRRVSGEAVIENPPTHQKISIMVNTSRETVTRALNHLKRMGIIEKSGTAIFVVNSDALRALMRDTHE
ncbi:MAG: Crp/Fnr family transcriptional regulator [Halothiobacillaceae bacterium]|nr:Crp/Fnr family transcriptional regulator [Halothiobacillaceae bacterium]